MVNGEDVATVNTEDVETGNGEDAETGNGEDVETANTEDVEMVSTEGVGTASTEGVGMVSTEGVEKVRKETRRMPLVLILGLRLSGYRGRGDGEWRGRGEGKEITATRSRLSKGLMWSSQASVDEETDTKVTAVGGGDEVMLFSALEVKIRLTPAFFQAKDVAGPLPNRRNRSRTTS
jgi:hypothetical protein